MCYTLVTFEVCSEQRNETTGDKTMTQLASYPKVNLEDYSVYEIADAAFDYKFETIKYMTQLRAAGMWNDLDELLKAQGFPLINHIARLIMLLQ
jgi:hypothetical protein